MDLDDEEKDDNLSEVDNNEDDAYHDYPARKSSTFDLILFSPRHETCMG